MGKPSEEEFDLVIEAIRYQYKNSPTPTPSTLLSTAESLGYKNRPAGVLILLDITQHTELKKISQAHIRSIINKLELVEKVLKDESPRQNIFSGKSFTIPNTIFTSPHLFSLIIFESFDNWYAAYQVKKNMKLEDMSLKALEHIYKWVSIIYEKFELNPDPEIILIEKDFKGDGLDFLYDKGVVRSHNLGYRGLDNEYEVKITLDVEKFIKFKPELEKAYLSKLGKPPNKKDPKGAIDVPLNTKWEDITIQFVNGHDVKIKIRDKTSLSDFKQMGFEDTKRRLPNQQWELLETLAENRGEISWGDSGATIRLKKRKQLLSQALKAYFRIDEDPFLPYKQEKAYKIRINLIPE